MLGTLLTVLVLETVDRERLPLSVGILSVEPRQMALSVSSVIFFQQVAWASETDRLMSATRSVEEGSLCDVDRYRSGDEY